MKKIIAAAGLVLIIAAAGIPFFRGIAVERIVRGAFADINRMYEDSGTGMSVEIREYDRNFLSSRIEWELKAGALEPLYGIESIVFVENADHGFIKTVSNTTLERNKWFTDFVDQELDGRNPLTISTCYPLSGEIESTCKVDGFSFAGKGKTVQVRPGHVSINLDRGLENIRSEVDWGGMTSTEEFSMGRFEMKSKMKRITGRIWDGNASCRMEKLTAWDADTELQVDNLTYELTSSFDGDKNTVSIESGYGADMIASGDSKIDKPVMEVAVNHMDAKRYGEFAKLWSEAAAGILEKVDPEAIKEGRGAGKAVERQMGRAGMQIAAACEKLLTKGLEIRVSRLQADFPQGRVKGSIMLKLKKDMTFVRFLPIANDPAAALDVFSLKSDFRLPYQMAQQRQTLLSPVYPGMQTGFFVKKGDDLVHKAETRDGKLFLNGKEVLLQ